MYMTHFAPFAALAGGALIGVAAVLLMLGIGRIAGVSGILLSAFVSREPGGIAWRAAFIVGLPLGALLVFLIGAKDLRSLSFPAGALATAVAGLLVGLGTTIGSGCTSGHGVCGIARLSKRSVIATVVFFATAAMTVFIARHVI